MTLVEVLRAASDELTRQDARFALVGGLAVSTRTEPRFTRDIDLAVTVTDDRDAEQRVRTMVSAGFTVDAAVEQRAIGRLATVRLCPPGAPGSIVDLLFATSGIEPDLVARAEPIEVLPGLTVPVARTGDLMALKLLARDDAERPQDAADLTSLAQVAGQDDWDLARAACRDIMDRGFNRERDLLRALHELTRR